MPCPSARAIVELTLLEGRTIPGLSPGKSIPVSLPKRSGDPRGEPLGPRAARSERDDVRGACEDRDTVIHSVGRRSAAWITR